jgi:ABC-type multidrug transport system ATPase subunit
MNEAVLTFDQISKRFGTHEVIKGITFSLRQGECVALTGLNGSGKTTLLKLAAGLARPSSGIVRTKGRIRIQYIPESFPRLNVSAYSILRSLGKAEGLRKDGIEQRIDQLLGIFSLDESANMPLRTYSKGMLQKVFVIQAFISRADVLLLDEPLSGQDRESQEAFTRLTEERLLEGTAVLLACHEKPLIHTLAGTVLEIRNGALHAREAPMDEGEDVYLFELPEEGFQFPEDLEGVFRTEKRGREMLVAVPHGSGDTMLKRMLQAGSRLREMCHEKDR